MTKILSDNSLAYAVRVNFDSDTLRIDMISERDALAFADSFLRLVNKHTNEEAWVY